MGLTLLALALLAFASCVAARAEGARFDPLIAVTGALALAAASALLVGRLEAAQRWGQAVLTLAGASALCFCVWVFCALMMAFACDAARGGLPALDAAFRILHYWRYVAPAAVLLLTVAVAAGKPGLPARAWLVLAGVAMLWFGAALACLIAGLRQSP